MSEKQGKKQQPTESPEEENGESNTGVDQSPKDKTDSARSQKTKKNPKKAFNLQSETFMLYLRSIILVAFMLLPMLAIYDHFLETLLHPYGSWGLDIPNVLLGAIGYENWIGRLALIGILAAVGILVNVWYFTKSKEQIGTDS